MKIILLQSNDGADWVWPIVIPKGMSGKKALRIASEIIDRTKEADPDNYNQTDIENLLVAAGFQCPAYIQGPDWD